MLELPVSHGEGCYVADPGTLARLEGDHLVALRYVASDGGPVGGQSPNGSLNDIAGIVNETGNVLGMMPHPSTPCEMLLGSADGLRLFRAVASEVAKGAFGVTSTASRPSSATLAQLALSESDYDIAEQRLGRPLGAVELGIVGALWSEHCSYRSSRVLLGRLPTKGPRVLQGPGENAGVIDIGNGRAVVFKIESHNHPSAVEPYQGAATGVGGILRDIFTMGARPVALLDSLRFGPLEEPAQRRLFDGVVSGIGSYGNCIGVPTVGGEVYFDAAYRNNCLVNAMCVGVVEHRRLTRAGAAGPGNPVLLVGADTGRDGIHGATFASVELDEERDERRPAVQVGNPFLEKCLMEACLELAGDPRIVAMQDLGAAGLTSSARPSLPTEAAAGSTWTSAGCREDRLR